MTSPTPPLVFIDLYQSKPKKVFKRAQTWRWRAINGNNRRVLGSSADAYTNRQDCLDAITQLFGAGTNIYLRQHETGNQVLRMADSNPPL